MKTPLAPAAAILALASIAAPADARRTAIDQSPDPNDPTAVITTSITFDGYCDLDGVDCNRAYTLPFDVTTGSVGPTNALYISANGLLSFGDPFFTNPFGNGRPYFAPEDDISRYYVTGTDFATHTDYVYGRSLYSSGLDNDFDPSGDHYYQSASVSIAANGTISAEWFTCINPLDACEVNPTYLTLTPTSAGYAVSITSPFPSSNGYAFDGQFVEGASLIPATFSRIGAPAVPEPASWALTIGGIGLVGAAVRRRVARLRAAPA